LQATDAYRKRGRFQAFLQACASDFYGRPGFAEKSYPQSERLSRALFAAHSVDAGAIAMQLGRSHPDYTNLPMLINQRVREARIEKIKSFLQP
jgi:tRNA nucleotidyltransferase (CCA-adding enzyme)